MIAVEYTYAVYRRHIFSQNTNEILSGVYDSVALGLSIYPWVKNATHNPHFSNDYVRYIGKG